MASGTIMLGTMDPFSSVARKPVAYELNPARVGQFSINFSTPNASDTIVRYTVAGTATNGVDYTTVPSSMTIPSGQTNVFINISAINNTGIDSDRTVTLTLTNNTGYVLGTATNATVTIRNDDLTPATVAFSENFDTDFRWPERLTQRAGIQWGLPAAF